MVGVELPEAGADPKRPDPAGFAPNIPVPEEAGGGPAGVVVPAAGAPKRGLDAGVVDPAGWAVLEGAPNIPPVEDVDVVDGVLLAAAAFPPKEKVDLGAAAPALDAPKRFEPVLAPLPVLVEAPKRPPPVAVPAADPPPNKLAPDPAVAVLPA